MSKKNMPGALLATPAIFSELAKTGPQGLGGGAIRNSWPLPVGAGALAKTSAQWRGIGDIRPQVRLVSSARKGTGIVREEEAGPHGVFLRALFGLSVPAGHALKSGEPPARLGDEGT